MKRSFAAAPASGRPSSARVRPLVHRCPPVLAVACLIAVLTGITLAFGARPGHAGTHAATVLCPSPPPLDGAFGRFSQLDGAEGNIVFSIPAATLRNPWAGSPAPPTPLHSEHLPVLPVTRAAYRAAKKLGRAAARPRRSPRAHGDHGSDGLRGIARVATTPTLLNSFEGTDEFLAGGNPPDTHGGVGTDYFVEVTQDRVQIFDKYNGTLYPEHNTTVESFLATNGETVQDPRAIKDPLSARWIVVASDLEPSGTQQYIWIAVSETEDARGVWWTYPKISIPMAAGDQDADFPYIGADGSAVLLTINVGPAATVLPYSAVLAFPKSYLLEGSSACVAKRLYDDAGARLPFGLTPPLVRDSNPSTFFIAPIYRDPNTTPTSIVKLYAGHDLGNYYQAGLTARPNVAVTPYTSPVDARQCPGNTELDTGFSTFVSASTQIGNWLWNVHTTSTDNGTNPTATPRFYEFNTSTNSVNRTAELYATTTSQDWNASIAADSGNYAFATWTAKEPDTCISAPIETRYSALAPGETPTQMRPGAALPLGQEAGKLTDTTRWGDMSSVTIDPSVYGSCARRAYVLNEKAKTQTVWGSRFGSVAFC